MEHGNGNPERELISVVIPAYNRENVILRSIESVLNQTYRDFELIVVDDGSTDSTAAVVENLKDPRIRVVRLDSNHGMCYARNAGAEVARGAYISCHDSDDVWEKEKLEKQYRFLKHNHCDLVFCRIWRGPEGGEKQCIPAQDLDLGDDVYRKLLLGNFTASPTLFMTREVSESVKFAPEVRRFTDWDFVLRVLKAGFTIGYLREALVTSYIQKDSTSVTANAYQSARHIYERFQQDIDAYPPARARHMYVLGSCVPAGDSTLAKRYFRESLKSRFSWMALGKYMLLCLGLLQAARFIRRKLRAL